MYENHFKRAEEEYGKLEGYDSAETGEKCVILLRSKGFPYSNIQAWMGNPSKKWIRQVLLKWAPELIDLDCNYHKLKAQPTKSIEKQVINKLNQLGTWTVETEEDIIEFYMKDDKLRMKSDFIADCNFMDWDETTQKQILNSI